MSILRKKTARFRSVIRYTAAFIFLIALSAAVGTRSFSSDYPAPDYRTVRKGLRYGRVELDDPPLIYHVVRVDLTAPGLEVRPIRGKGRKEDMGKMAARVIGAGRPLLAAINGDYFTPANETNFFPWGILIEDGKLIFSPTEKSAFLIDEGGDAGIGIPDFTAAVHFSGGKKHRLAAVNRRPDTQAGECVLFTRDWNLTAPAYDKGTAVTVSLEGAIRNGRIDGQVRGISRMPVEAPIPENGCVLVFPDSGADAFTRPSLGDGVSIDIRLPPAPRQALGGGPRLVRDGKISVETDRENFSMTKTVYLSRGRDPRSAAGITSDGRELIMVVVEGRSRRSGGLKMDALAVLMKQLGAEQAMSFDGGRSVGLFLDGAEAVRGEREICDALGVFERRGVEE